MIQKKAMGSFSCSLMNMGVRESTLGKMFLVIEWCHPEVVFLIRFRLWFAAGY
ncbi:hypothetical protein [Pseudomonas laurylsulfatiphila]|jgi:hypothetical protein|uniref:hypothetical protein n=1 Tax=Pseudomonas laurylsulfatiphila TaxID=2011015 RepID=UPI0013048F79|nr:hypothetical protein [Pseudomonas laurylsulfatiphila]